MMQCDLVHGQKTEDIQLFINKGRAECNDILLHYKCIQLIYVIEFNFFQFNMYVKLFIRRRRKNEWNNKKSC